MRNLAAIALAAALGWLLGLWLPFWSLAVAAAAAGYVFAPRGWSAFLAGCAAGAMLWGLLAYAADAANGHLLGGRVGALFGTGAAGMVALTAVAGALLAGPAMALGSRLRNAAWNP